MNEWSEYIQSAEELYRTRALRFNERNKDIWLKYLDIKNKAEILEAGCGSGLFCHRLKLIYPDCNVTGIDLDEGLIEYAKKKSAELGAECNFFCLDATDTGFEPESFDLSFSHTLIEHLNPVAFFKEQKKLLKKGARLVVFSVKDEQSFENFDNATAEEGELLAKAWSATGGQEQFLSAFSYPVKEKEIASILNKLGFSKITIDYFAVTFYNPDSSDMAEDEVVDSINTNRLLAINCMEKALKLNPDALSDKEKKRLSELINTRFDERLAAYHRGEKIWDTGAVMMSVITAVK